MNDELENQIQAQDCELEYWLQQANNYAEVQISADDLRAIIARAYAAVNALPELLAVKAERDRAQRACEQMGQRITLLEAALKPFSDKAHYWLERDDIHGLDDDDECATEIRFGDLRRAAQTLKERKDV